MFCCFYIKNGQRQYGLARIDLAKEEDMPVEFLDRGNLKTALVYERHIFFGHDSIFFIFKNQYY